MLVVVVVIIVSPRCLRQYCHITGTWYIIISHRGAWTDWKIIYVRTYVDMYMMDFPLRRIWMNSASNENKCRDMISFQLSTLRKNLCKNLPKTNSDDEIATCVHTYYLKRNDDEVSFQRIYFLWLSTVRFRSIRKWWKTSVICHIRSKQYVILRSLYPLFVPEQTTIQTTATARDSLDVMMVVPAQ